jgi:tyrosine-specific transport protein
MLKPLHGAILLVAGTSVGAGMLALPVSTAKLGFLGSGALLILSWYIMYLSALIMLEVNLSFESGANIISMATRCFGVIGKIFAWTIYLLLLYVLNSAYLSALSDMLLSLSPNINHITSVMLVGSFFLFLLYSGTIFIDKINRFLMLGLALSFIGLVLLFCDHITPQHAMSYGWFGIEDALPVLATSFGFHIIIPSLRSYLDSDVSSLKSAIFYGSLIPLIIYLIWQFLVFSSLPLWGQYGLLEVLHSGKVSMLINTLVNTLNSPIFSLLVNLFSFFIITTSFIGVSLSLFDFLFDGLNIKPSNNGKLFISILTFLPPIIIVGANLNSFFGVLSFAGLLVVLLLCLLPLAMLFSKRYYLGLSENRFVGSIGIFLVSFFAIAVAILEIFS